MIHDHLCPHVQVENQRDDVACQCNLIAKIRDNAIAAAVQRVEALPHALECVTRDENYNRACNCLWADALDAIKGDQP